MTPASLPKSSSVSELPLNPHRLVSLWELQRKKAGVK